MVGGSSTNYMKVLFYFIEQYWSSDWNAICCLRNFAGRKPNMQICFKLCRRLRPQALNSVQTCTQPSTYRINVFNFLYIHAWQILFMLLQTIFILIRFERKKYFRLPLLMQILLRIFSAFLNLSSLLNHEKFSDLYSGKVFFFSFLATNLERITTSNASQIILSCAQKCFW